MFKINIIISKRGRDDYLKLVLHNFNNSANIKNYDVVLYIGEDVKANLNKIEYNVYKNIKVKHLYVSNLPQAGDLFCRGHIINVLLQKMRQDYDFVCVADTDMIYRKSFFEDLVNVLGSGQDTQRCLIAKGVYMDEASEYKKILTKKYDYDAIIQESSYVDFATNSQISITRAYHEKIKQVLGVKSIFDSGSLGYNFIGYGAEDTLAKRIMQFSKAEVVMLQDVWVHVWHERQEIIDENHKYNRSIVKPLQREIVQRLKAGNYYSNRHLKKLMAMLGIRESKQLAS